MIIRVHRQRMSDETTTEESPASTADKQYVGDAKLFCRRCWRDEYHFHSYRARRPVSFQFWRIACLGLLDLVGPYRCRCCGHRRFWRLDFQDAQAAREGAAARNRRQVVLAEPLPFRNRFSVTRWLRRGFRSLRRRVFGNRNRRRRF